MEKWSEWLKDHKKAIILCAFGIVIGGPMIIHIVFSIPAPWAWMIAKWSAGDVLGYYGSVLGFCGTTLLSVLALYQNKMIKDDAENRENVLLSPVLTCKCTGYSGQHSSLNFELYNRSVNAANSLEVENFKLYDTDGKCVLESSNVELPRFSILGGETLKITFKNKGFPDMHGTLEFVVYYNNRLGERIKTKVSFVLRGNVDTKSEMSLVKI